jgi:hypothetical protein
MFIVQRLALSLKKDDIETGVSPILRTITEASLTNVVDIAVVEPVPEFINF